MRSTESEMEDTAPSQTEAKMNTYAEVVRKQRATPNRIKRNYNDDDRDSAGDKDTW